MGNSTDLDKGHLVKQSHCIADEFLDNHKTCKSSDALAIYEHDGEDGGVWYDAHCFSCVQSFSMEEVHSSSHAKELGVGDSGVVVNRVKMDRQSKAEPLTRKEVVKLIKEVGYKSGNYRSIKDEYSQFFGHLTKLDSNGSVIVQYYPETEEEKVIGYKPRYHPKQFGRPIGKTGINSDLSGQVKFKDYDGHRDVLIVGGELDKVSAYQMLREYQKSKKQEGFAPIAVVSPTTGEGSAFKQVQAQYEFLDRFENIIIGFDNDDAGREATKKVIEMLPKSKIKIASWTDKDPNAALQKGNERQFISDYFGAKDLVESNIIKSGDLDEAMIQELLVEKISLPSYMHVLEEILAGGIPRGVIVNLIGTTKQGKTTNANEMIYHWIFNILEMIGVMSLELSKGQYAVAMLSRHIGKKLQLFKTSQEALDYINQPEIIKKREELWKNEYGEDRWYLLDERDGHIEATKRHCEMLHKKYGCRLIIMDPLNDLIGSSSNEEQESFMSWQKNFVKNGVSIINVCHTRKTGAGTSKDNENKNLRELSEDDVQGSSSIPKSGAANIYYHRDMYSNCPIMRNTTWVKCVCRWSGFSGWAGRYYYDPETHTSYDFDDYFNKYPEKLPEGFDKDATPFNKKKDEKKPFRLPTSKELIKVKDFVTMDDGEVVF